MPVGKGAAAETRQPPRYDDVVPAADGDDAPSRSLGTTNAPASATRGNATDPGTFRVEQREDFVESPDRRKAKPREIVDLVSRTIGLATQFSTAASFDWCRDTMGRRLAFSRRYPQDGAKPDVLVDLFANDLLTVREEIAYKQKCIREHNATAAAFVETTLATVEERVLEAVEREEKNPVQRDLAIDGPPPSIETRVEAAKAAALLFLRRDGLVPCGYVPIVGNPRELDLESLHAGGVLDLPPR